MLYYGDFASIDNKNFRIEIETKTKGETRELRLSGSPFTTTLEDEEDYIYTPIKSGGATVGLRVGSFNEDFYAPNATDVRVTLYKEGKVEWTGFIVPTCYDQDFSSPLDELQLDCVDGIAALKNIQYKRITSTNGTVSFFDVFNQCLGQLECYERLYVSDNLRIGDFGGGDSLMGGTSDRILERLYINQSAFFEERKDADQTDDDLAMSCFEVLYQLCQFLGYTMFADGENVFVVDYDAIKKGNTSYHIHDLKGRPTSLRPENISYKKFIDGDDRAEKGDKISLDEIYNKVTVKDRFNKLDNLFPQFTDDMYYKNATNSNDSTFNSWVIWENTDLNSDKRISQHHSSKFNSDTDDWGAYWYITDSFDDPESGESYQAAVVRPMRGDEKKDLYIVIAKFCHSQIAKFTHYSNLTDTKAVMLEPAIGLGFPYMMNAHGAFYVKLFKQKIDEGDWKRIVKIHKTYVGQDRPATSNYDRLQAWVHILNMNPSKLNYENYIISMNDNLNGHRINKDEDGGTSYEKYDAGYSYYSQYPVFEWEAPSLSLGGRNAALIISGQMTCHDEFWTPFPMLDGGKNDKLKYKGDYKFYFGFYLWAKLQIGDYYWNGEEWTKENCGFKLPFGEKYEEEQGYIGWADGSANKKIKVNEYFDKTFDIFGTSIMNVLVDEKGYYVPIPDDMAIYGDAKFTLYANRDFDGTTSGGSVYDGNYDRGRYRSEVICLKNLKIKPYIINGILEEAVNDSDTKYTNVIDNNAVSKMQEIEFKVCTFDNKVINNNSVLYKQGDELFYLQNLYNNSLYSDEYQTMGVDGEYAKLRQEEHYVFKMVTQYEKPRMIFDCTVHEDGNKLFGLYTNKTLSGRNFIISGCETDYKMNKQTLKLKQIL